MFHQWKRAETKYGGEWEEQNNMPTGAQGEKAVGCTTQAATLCSLAVDKETLQEKNKTTYQQEHKKKSRGLHNSGSYFIFIGRWQENTAMKMK